MNHNGNLKIMTFALVLLVLAIIGALMHQAMPVPAPDTTIVDPPEVFMDMN